MEAHKQVPCAWCLRGLTIACAILSRMGGGRGDGGGGMFNTYSCCLFALLEKILSLILKY